MKALITGGAGFVGKYLIDELSGAGWEIHASCMENEKIPAKCEIHTLNITDGKAACEVVSDVSPDVIFHLSAQSSVALSWEKPALTAEVNIIGAVNILEAARLSGKNIRVLLIGSGDQYGKVTPADCPLKEEKQTFPANIYAVTKTCQEMFGQVYSRTYGMDIVSVRAFNHTGAGQSPVFAVSGFCRQAAEILKGLRPPVIETGNLSAKRDFTDVRDIVRAYRLLAEKGISGNIYNVGRGKAVSLQEVLDMIIEISGCKAEIIKDPARMRASDIPVTEPDVSEIFSDTGWRAEISLEETVRDMIDYWYKIL